MPCCRLIAASSSHGQKENAPGYLRGGQPAAARRVRAICEAGDSAGCGSKGTAGFRVCHRARGAVSGNQRGGDTNCTGRTRRAAGVLPASCAWAAPAEQKVGVSRREAATVISQSARSAGMPSLGQCTRRRAGLLDRVLAVSKCRSAGPPRRGPAARKAAQKCHLGPGFRHAAVRLSCPESATGRTSHEPSQQEQRRAGPRATRHQPSGDLGRPVEALRSPRPSSRPAPPGSPRTARRSPPAHRPAAGIRTRMEPGRSGRGSHQSPDSVRSLLNSIMNANPPTPPAKVLRAPRGLARRTPSQSRGAVVSCWSLTARSCIASRSHSRRHRRG